MNSQSASHEHHIVPLSHYFMVAGALFVLTVITVAVSYVNWGTWNLLVAMAVAAFKGSLVAMVFMHLWYDRKLYFVIFVGSIVFLAIFILFTMADTMERGTVNEIRLEPIKKDAVLYDNWPPEGAGHGAGHGSDYGAAADTSDTNHQVVDTTGSAAGDHSDTPDGEKSGEH